jgi:hypothetical protein
VRSAPIIWPASIRNDFYEGEFKGLSFIVLGQHFDHAGHSDEGTEGGTDVGGHHDENNPDDLVPPQSLEGRLVIADHQAGRTRTRGFQ